MDLKEQIITEYLTQGCGFRKLAAKYGISPPTPGRQHFNQPQLSVEIDKYTEQS